MKLEELTADARTLTADAFRAKYGEVFLVGIAGALRPPKRFEKTQSSPASPAPLGKAAIDWIILPVRKRDRSISLLRITVGRTANNDVPVEDPSVSHLHAFFERAAEGWTVRDSGSRLGTRVNGAGAPSATAIKSGDQVQFGDVDFTFMDVAALVYFVDRMSPR